VGARTDAARAEVLAAREDLGEELVRLEAAGRAAVDIPARIRREPAKVAGSAAGAAFLLLGGPRRVFRGVRKAVFGPEAELPKSMLPPEIDKTLRKLGPDGEKVRGTLEREFAEYLEEKAPQRSNGVLDALTGGLVASLVKPLTERAGRQLLGRLLESDGTTFGDALRRARDRQAGTGGSSAATSSGSTSGNGPEPGRRDNTKSTR